MVVYLIWMFLPCAFSKVVAQVETGFYWVDYYGGCIPKTALKLDPTSDVYVGQLYTKKYELLPAAVRTSPPLATTYAYSLTVVDNKNIKVLCSNFLDRFKWVKTNSTSYHSIPNLVQAGTEVGGITYVGRVYVNNKAVLSKLLHNNLSYTINGGPIQFHTREFDILTYEKPDNDYFLILFKF